MVDDSATSSNLIENIQEEVEIKVVSPIDQSVIKNITLDTPDQALGKVEVAESAFKGTWRSTPLQDRIDLVLRFVDCLLAKKHEIVKELSWMMGRPLKQNYGELIGFENRARHMCAIAKESLADIRLPEKDGFVRFIRREPLGVVFVLAPFNFPYMCMVHSIAPALIAGNTVLLKQSPQTMATAERFVAAFKEAGLPGGVFQSLAVNHTTAALVMKQPSVQFISFTGSLRGGITISETLSHKFIKSVYELGGKDPSYLREDVDLNYAIEPLLFMTMYNSGQCCFGTERIYVHEAVYDEFIARVTEGIKKFYTLGDPLQDETTIGPVVSLRAASMIRSHCQEAMDKGAKPLIDEHSVFPMAKPGTNYIAPNLFVGVDHTMQLMVDETFGPVAGIIKVSSDEEAIRLMNDSVYGLTASVWTEDVAAAERIGQRLECGIVFMNRGDMLCPEMPWLGTKSSGMGVTISRLGFDMLTRPKSFHFRTKH